MKTKLRLENIMITIVLFVGMLFFFFKSDAFSFVDEGITAVVDEVVGADSSIATFSQVSAAFLDGFYDKNQLLEFNGGLAKKLGFNDFYKDTGGIKLSNGYVAGVYAKTATDYEIQQMNDLKAFCDEEGVQLLYVNEPTKYIDDAIIEEDLGLKSYINQNTDIFLRRLEENGIRYIDLRDNIRSEEKNSFDLFYRTDHHWTTESGKWAARIIADELNKDYGYGIDTSVYDDSKYDFTEYKSAWLGEQGKKLSASYVGLDDYTCIEPKFATNYTVTTVNGTVNGTFSETMINKGIYSQTGDLDTIYASPSWHYSYMYNGLNTSVIRNNNLTTGKILVLGDSYDQVTSPFLSLGVNEVQTLVLRDYTGSLKEYIKQNDPDTVIVAYASFMIGAHDDPNSANYAMFDFH